MQGISSGPMRRLLRVAGWVSVPLILIALGSAGGFLFNRATDSSPVRVTDRCEPIPDGHDF
jgi:hypothetical protein